MLVVDDHWIVRQGLGLIIEQEPDMDLVGSVASGEEAIAVYAREKPDVVLMDLLLPGIDGIEAIGAIRQSDPQARIVVLTMHDGDECIHRALEAGAKSYLLKGASSIDLVRVIREVHLGGKPLQDDIRERLDDRGARPGLTPREVDVLQLVSEGNRNKEIADLLSISEETVQVHLRNVFGKLDVRDRTAAVHVALRRGIIHVRSHS